MNLLVDKIWLKDGRVYFRVLEMLSERRNHLRKEKGPNIYSINEKNIFCIRCSIYLLK
ncbi:MAG: hypothetical protein ACTSPH_02165 [Promethearchaeota archaeon]